jgi:hypothetical protein
MAESDFYDVRLTAAGAKLAQVRVQAAHIDYLFAPGETTRVLTSEWRKLLSCQIVDGHALLEIAPPSAPAKPTPTSVPEESPQAQPAPQPSAAAEAKSTKGGK